MHGSSDLIDPFGRAITYIRVSVTDRCDFRCSYCMAEDMTFLPRHELLSLEELDRLCSAFIEMGTQKIRITGGEPLVRRDIMRLFRSLSQHLEAGALDEMTLTTNGSQLVRFADELIRRSSGDRWSIWCDLDARPRSWRVSSSRPPSRFPLG